MTELKDMMIEDLVNALFSDQYYYNTDKWVELQSVLRGVWLHSFLAVEPSDYLNIVRCLGDEYQDVRLIAYHWMVENSEIVFNIMKEEGINKELSYFYQAHQETIDMDFSQILAYTDQDHSREYKKALLFMVISKNLPIVSIKEMVDVLDDQDTFDYFYNYLIE